mmetsp:Transcript_33914/g.93814  ORF Transcript_33914/g.93814 Transcript_33914/m.93814 type:complete len:417 (+) Transcript_33914:327-1577(+)
MGLGTRRSIDRGGCAARGYMVRVQVAQALRLVVRAIPDVSIESTFVGQVSESLLAMLLLEEALRLLSSPLLLLLGSSGLPSCPLFVALPHQLAHLPSFFFNRIHFLCFFFPGSFLFSSALLFLGFSPLTVCLLLFCFSSPCSLCLLLSLSTPLLLLCFLSSALCLLCLFLPSLFFFGLCLSPPLFFLLSLLPPALGLFCLPPLLLCLLRLPPLSLCLFCFPLPLLLLLCLPPLSLCLLRLPPLSFRLFCLPPPLLLLLRLFSSSLLFLSLPAFSLPLSFFFLPLPVCFLLLCLPAAGLLFGPPAFSLLTLQTLQLIPVGLQPLFQGFRHLLSPLPQPIIGSGQILYTSVPTCINNTVGNLGNAKGLLTVLLVDERHPTLSPGCLADGVIVIETKVRHIIQEVAHALGLWGGLPLLR